MSAPPAATDSKTSGTVAHQRAILVIICISYFMVILDNSIIFTGLPRIESAMHFSPTGLTWVQDAYTLVFGGLLLLGARAGDIVAYLTRMLYLAAMIGFFFFTTQYLQGVLGFSPLQAGLAFLPMSAVNFAAALLVTRFIRQLGPTTVLVLGVAITLAGVAWLSRVAADSSYLTAVALPMVLIGIGQGLAFAPMTSAGLADVDAYDAGAASGLVNTFHQLGSSLGLGILATVGAVAVPAGASGTAALVDRVSGALTAAAALLAVALVAVLALIAWRGRTRPSQLPALEAQATRAAAGIRS